MISFDLRNEPWIPVLRPDGSRVELGLRDVIVQAHEFKTIAADNPLQTISLYRVLVGLIQHLLGDITGAKEWVTLFSQGRFDAQVVDDYFDRSTWSDRFDLFHPDRPFWQVPGLTNIDEKTGAERPVSAKFLDMPEATGNNKTLFSHRYDADENWYAPARAARLLCTAQFFALGGLNKKSTNRTGHQQSYYNAPLVAGMPSMLMGKNLFQTMCLNLVPRQGRLAVNTVSFRSLGIPPWAQDPFGPGTELPSASEGPTVPGTFLEYFLPWSRYIRLVPREQPSGAPSVTHVHIAQGVAFDPLDEPWTAKRTDTKTAERKPVPFNPERALWRDAGAFLGLTSASGDRQYTKSVPLQRYSDYRKHSKDSLPFMVPMAVFALANDKAKPLLWRQEELRVPDVEEQNIDIAKDIQHCLETAESVGGILKAAVARLVEEYLRNSDRGRDALPARISNSSSALRNYWSRLDLPFRRFLTGEIDADGFVGTCLVVAEESFTQYARQTVGADVRYFPAFSKARLQLRGSLKKKRKNLSIQEVQHAE
jgi:CRISPR system Cascade subunit CasA